MARATKEQSLIVEVQSMKQILKLASMTTTRTVLEKNRQVTIAQVLTLLLHASTTPTNKIKIVISMRQTLDLYKTCTITVQKLLMVSHLR
jgi:hypothetical protein